MNIFNTENWNIKTHEQMNTWTHWAYGIIILSLYSVDRRRKEKENRECKKSRKTETKILRVDKKETKMGAW